MIITKLMDIFIRQDAASSMNSDDFLQKVAGQALAMLTMESVDNCAAIVMERANFLEELTILISGVWKQAQICGCQTVNKHVPTHSA